MRVAGEAALPANLFERLVVGEVAVGGQVHRRRDVVMQRVAPLHGPGILLSRQDDVAVLLVLSSTAPRRLVEVSAREVPHLHEVREVDVLGRRVGPGGLVLHDVSADVHVAVGGVPAARRKVGMALEIHGESGLPPGTNLHRAAMRAILDPPRHDQFVGPGGHLGVVASAHVEGLAVRRRPERARTHPQPPHLVGETVDEDRRLRGQREPSGAVVKADARRYQRPRGGIADLELDSAGGRARARRPRAGHLDVAQRERPTGRPHGEIDTAGALTGEPGTIELDRDLSERRAGFDLDGGTPQPLAAVRVPVES